jgi:dipeptidyl aminopeptidase/acylaminoacyl peptidase
VRAGQRSFNIARVRFDAGRGRLDGRHEMLTRGANAFGAPDVSPDDKWVAFNSAWHPGTQEDIYIMRADGTGLRRLTDDSARDRGPRFTRDGLRIMFNSNRAGNHEIWSIAPDGANLTRLGGQRRDTVSPVPSPVDSRVAVCVVDQDVEESVIFDGSRPFGQQQPVRISAPGPGLSFAPDRWSPDATELLGPQYAGGPSSLRAAGIVAYNLESRRYRDVWLGGSAVPLRDRRVVVCDEKGRLVLIDPASGRSTELLSLEGDRVFGAFSISRDERWIYFTVQHDDADVWLLELK